MTDEIDPSGPPPTGAITVGPDSLQGLHRQPGATLGLLLGADLIAVTTAGADGAYRLALPAHALSGLLDVVELETARSILDTQIELADIRPIEWIGWSCRSHGIVGAFRLRSSPPMPILIDAGDDDALYFQAVARPEPDGIYRFHGRLISLPRPDQVLTLCPRVGGLLVDDPLTLSVLDVRAAGQLDRTSDNEARGWLLDPSEPSRRLDVDIWLDGRPAGRVTPGLLREDLRDLGVEDGQFGFVFPFPPGNVRRGLTKVQAFVAETGIELPGSPYLLDVPSNVVGCLDWISDHVATGWAIDLAEPGTPVPLEAVCGDLVVGTGTTGLHRADVLQAGMPTAECGFALRLTAPLSALLDRDIDIRAAGTTLVLDGSPRRIDRDGSIVRFLTRRERIAPPVQRRLAASITRRTAATPLTLVLLAAETSPERLARTIDQVLAQWSANWTLLCIDDGTRPAVATLLAAAAARDGRIRTVLAAPDTDAIADAIAAALPGSASAWTVLLDADDVLEPDAVQRLATAAATTDADLVYADAALTGEHPDAILDVAARPAFSLDQFLARPIDLRPLAIRTGLLLDAGAPPGAPFSAIGTTLRVLATAGTVAHVPGVLSRRRLQRAEPAPDPLLQNAVRRFLAATGRRASVSDGPAPGESRIDWPDDGGETLVIVRAWTDPERLHTCLASIEATTRTTTGLRLVVIDHAGTDAATAARLRDPEARHTVLHYPHARNAAAMDNMAARDQAGTSRYLLFVDNGVEALHEGWVQRLRSLVARPEIAAAGPLLLHADGTVRQAGLLLSLNGSADKSMGGHPATLGSGARNPGYHGNLTTTHDCSALTAACLLVRRDAFEAVGGFDEGYAVGFNGTDLCLRIIEAGYHVLYDGQTILTQHQEMENPADTGHIEDERRLATRWQRYFRDGDPFYSPLLADTYPDHVLRDDDGCRSKMRPRLVRLSHAHPPPPLTLKLPPTPPKPEKPPAKGRPKAKPKGRPRAT